MNYRKKNIAWILVMVGVDQLIKLAIYLNCMDADVSLISDLVKFQPLRNINLSWGGNFFALSRNPIFLYTLNVLGLVFIPIAYHYLWNTTLAETKWSRITFTTIMAGMICSLVDKLGGGSIDYIYLKNLFTFDLKDCYLSLWEVAILIYLVLNWKTVKNLKLKDIIKFYRKK